MEAVESMFAEIGLLVLEGDAAGLAAKVSELAAARRDAPAQPGEPLREGEGTTGEPGGGEANGQHSHVDLHGAPAPLVHSPHS